MNKHEPWSVRSRRIVFAGGPIREIALEHVVLPNGEEIREYCNIRLADFALVFATTEEGRVILLRQYKHGVKRVCLMFPGGAVDDGELPLEAARRELVEETGYASEKWTDLGGFVTNSNQRCNTAHFFRAERCRRVSLPTSPDIEGPDLLLISKDDLLTPASLQEIGLVSHVALLLMATHPHLCSR
jgi:ADP-ribose pyrophosphatase